MFTRLLYLNKDRVIEYNSLLSNEDYVELGEIEIKNANTLGADGKLIRGERGTQRNYKGKVYASESRLWNMFYNNLKTSDDYIDYIDEDKSIEAIGRGLIIRFETEIVIPDDFDTFSILNAFPESFIQDQIVGDCNYQEIEKNIVKGFFKMKKASLPICMNYEGKILCSKLYSNYFLCADEEFEECLEDELVVVAKVISPKKAKRKEIFNPLKDFFVLNRAIRRTLDIENAEGLESIFVDDDYVDLEILAIYQ